MSSLVDLTRNYKFIKKDLHMTIDYNLDIA